MRKFLLALILSSGCTHASSKRQINIAWTDSVKLDHDQTVICMYLQKKDVLICMSPEEYAIRYEAINDDQKENNK